MQQSIRQRVLGALWPALIGALYALGLILPVFRALEVATTGRAIWACGLTALACAAASFGGGRRWIRTAIGGAVLLLALLLLGAFAGLGGLFSALVELVRGDTTPLRGYGPQLSMLVGCLLTLGGWTMTRQAAGFYPALSLFMIALLAVWFTGHRDVLMLFAPALIALCALFAQVSATDTPAPRVLLASALAVMLALAASPALQFRSDGLESFAERLRNYITDSLFFSETRSVYSIQMDGYKPLGSRLGGPIEPEDRPVMTVETPTTVLLRGVIYDRYSGLNWGISLSSRRYLFSDPRNRSIRADTLDELRPDASLRDADGLFRLADIHITMQASRTSTLFAPLRAENIVTPMSLVPYFNLSSELFITRDLEAGDEYSMSAPIISANDTRLSQLLSLADARGDDSKDMSAYLHLPEHISVEVYNLTAGLIEGAATPYEKAVAILNHLRTSYRYTLTPDAPPINQDFVSNFLLRGKEGYCTYFASAMAIMGRIAGLPTRYVEGYLAEPSGGVALVTSKQAHAWAEVYFDGFGWISFDATPPRSQGGPRPDEGMDGQNAWEEEAPTDEEDQPQSEEEAPDDQGEGGEDNQPQPGGNNAGAPTPTPTPQDEQTPDQQDIDLENMQDQDDKHSSLWWLWTLLALAAAALVIWRELSTRPARLAQSRSSDNAKLLTWYRSLLGLFDSADMPARPHETPIGYAQRVAQGIPEDAHFLSVAEAVTRMGYGRLGASPSDIAVAESCYHAVWKAVPWKGRIRWFLRRMLKGIGSIRQVP